MRIWLGDVTLEMVNDFNKETMPDFLGIEFVDMGEDFLTARMPVNNRTIQPAGIMHGGASCVLAETAGSRAAQFCVDREQFYCVGLDINTNHISSVREGFVTGIARPFHLGKSTQVWGIDIRNDDGKLVSVNRLTMAVLKFEGEKTQWYRDR